MRESATTTTTASSSGRWAPSYLLVPVLVLASYGLLRVAAVAWGIVRDGPPGSLLAWSNVVSDSGAAWQGIAAAVFLARLSLRRQVWAWSVGTVGVAAALFGATVWIVLGDSTTDAMRQTRQILLSLAFAIATAAMCGWRPAWARRSDADLDLARVRRALWIVAWSAAAVGAASGLVILAAHPAGAVDRLVVLGRTLGFWSAVVAVIIIMFVVGEQRSQAREAARTELYRRLEERYRDDDPDV